MAAPQLPPPQPDVFDIVTTIETMTAVSRGIS